MFIFCLYNTSIVDQTSDLWYTFGDGDEEEGIQKRITNFALTNLLLMILASFLSFQTVVEDFPKFDFFFKPFSKIETFQAIKHGIFDALGKLFRGFRIVFKMGKLWQERQKKLL